MKITKTNAMRLLDTHEIPYEVHSYPHKKDDPVDGQHVALALNEPFEQVYKTLVLMDKESNYFVFMCPVHAELDLKKCAQAAHVKSLSMLPLKDLTKITGYIRGGCSCLAMKKQFPTWIHEDALCYDTIFFSAGKIGMQIEMNPEKLFDVIDIHASDIIM